MTYAILIILLLLMAIGGYFLFEKDILSPSVISILMFLLCACFATIGLSSWNHVNKLSVYLILIIISGLVSFCFGEYLARKTQKNSKSDTSASSDFCLIKIKNWQYILTLTIIILTGILLILEIKRICNFYGYYSNNLASLLSFYRNKTGLFSNALAQDGIDINFVVKQMLKVSNVICIFFMYILVNNFFANAKKRSLLKWMLPILITLFITLLSSGGRSIFMHMMVALCMIFLLMFRQKNGFHQSKKMLLYIGGAFVTAIALFYILLPLVGRSTNTKFLDYITFYIGTPIPSFQLFLDNPPAPDIIGSETFSGVYYVLDKVGIIDFFRTGSHEWVNFNGLGSNVYTSLRRYYFDFGFLGVILCQFVFGFVISKIYLNIKNNKGFGFLIYCYYSYILIDQIRDEQFFTLINTSTIAYLLIFVVLYCFYFKLGTWKVKHHEKME